MNIGWMKKTLQVEIISKDNGYVFSYTKDWLYKHRNRYEYVFHEVDDGKDIYHSNYDIATDGTITIETSGGSGGGEGGGSGESGTTLYGPYCLTATNGGDGYNISGGANQYMEMDIVTDMNNNSMVVPDEPVSIIISGWQASTYPCALQINNNPEIYMEDEYLVAPSIYVYNYGESTARDVYGIIIFYTIGVELESMFTPEPDA